MARDRASRVGWKAKRASSYLLRIGRGWKAGWRAQHAAETGLARADRADVGARGRRDGARSGDRQDTKRTAYRWRELERNATRPGRKPPLDAATIERVVNLTLNEKPPTAPHWSARTLAKRSASAIRACSASGQRTGSNRI